MGKARPTPDLLNAVVADYTSLADSRVRAAIIGQAEIATLEGIRFDVEIDEDFAENEIKYFLFDMPSDSEGFAIALQNRHFQPAESFAEYEVLWDSTGFVAGNEVKSFNENRRSSQLGGMKVYRLDDGTNPTDDGTIREAGFAGKSGNPQTEFGAVDPRLGIRMYDDSFFILKIINGPSAQRIKCAYEWFKIPLVALKV